MNETTRLQAINTMLSCIGENPVSTLTGPLNADVVVAQQILDEVCRDLMSREWSWNTLRKQTLVADVNGNVAIPSNWVRVDHPSKDYAKKGTKLYDRENETAVFSGSVTDLVAVVLLEWDDMPEPARRYAMIRAGRTLGARMVNSEKVVAFSERDEMQAFMVLREFEAEQADYNIFNNGDVAFNNRRWA
jgi:hypothetical protein